MKWFRSRYKRGAIALIPISVIFFVIYSLLKVLWGWSVELGDLISNNILWKFLFIVGFLVSPFFIGLLISWKWLRGAALKAFSKVPIISLLVDLFFNHTNLEEGFQEVMFKKDNDTVLFGVVHGELIFPEELVDGPLVDWVVIILPTTPLSETGFPLMRKKSSVVYTGRILRDTAVSVASFCTKFKLDPAKFSQGKPQ